MSARQQWEPLTFGSVCTGIGAPEAAWLPLGWRPAWFAEIEPFPSSVLAHHYPRVPNLGDMTKLASYIRAGIVSAPDVLVGGTPCQAFSVAGLRAGLLDPRGQLTLSFVDLANAIDEKRPAGDECTVVWENVPGVLSDKANAFGCFLGLLAGEDGALVPSGKKWPNAGVVYGPQRAIAWRVLDAQYFGVAQRRRRVFVVASAREGFDPAAVLFEFDGVRRDSAPSRQAGQEVAGTISSRTTGGGGLGTDFECSGGLQPVVSTLDASYGRLQGCSGQDANRGHSHLVPVASDSRQDPVSSVEVFGALGSSSPQAQAVAFSCKDYGSDAAVELASTMRAMGHAGSHANAGGQLAVCVTGDITHTLKAEGFDASEDGTGRGQPIVAAFSDIASTLRVPSPGAAVRRLTPRECERLQGFPDDYTRVPHRGKPAADGPRYKALGNSMCTLVMHWLGARVDAHLRRLIVDALVSID